MSKEKIDTKKSQEGSLEEMVRAFDVEIEFL